MSGYFSTNRTTFLPPPKKRAKTLPLRPAPTRWGLRVYYSWMVLGVNMRCRNYQNGVYIGFDLQLFMTPIIVNMQVNTSNGVH